MNDAKEEVRSKLAIEDVIGEYVQLKRSGRYWKGLSPFTNERTPSFFVTPERDMWHDFSSGKGGDIFSFIMEVEGLDFRGALEYLAQKAGVDLSLYDNKSSRSAAQLKERIYRMNSLAVNYYQLCLTKSTVAMDYVFKKRSLTKSTVMTWGIGYAPERPQLKQVLAKRGYTDKEMRQAGLISTRGNEMFRGRMMIPLRDGQGQVVGFTGRIIGDGQPKYLNTPATLLYDKGRQLFGLNFAKQSIRKNDFGVVVEGNLDVISSHQAGVANVVGVAGTALTTWHLKSLGRLSTDVRFCFDSDRAGIAATERAIQLAEPLNLKLSVIDYGGMGAKDPDELIKEDAKKWQAALASHKPAVEWVMNRYADMVDIKTAEGRKVLTTKTLAIIKHLADPVEQEFYLKELSGMTDTSLDALRSKMSGSRNMPDAKPRLRSVKVKKQDYNRRDENYYLNNIFALTYKNATLRPLLKNLPDEYLSNVLKRLKYLLLGEPILDDHGRLSKVEITPELADKLAELELIASRSSGEDRLLLLESMNSLERLKIRDWFERASEDLARALDSNDATRVQELNAMVAEARNALNLIDRSSSRSDYNGLRELWRQRQESVAL